METLGENNNINLLYAIFRTQHKTTTEHSSILSATYRQHQSSSKEKSTDFFGGILEVALEINNTNSRI